MYPFQTKEYRSVFKKHFVTDLQTCVEYENTEYEILPDKRAIFMGMKPVLNRQEITDYGDIPQVTQEIVQSHIEKLKTDRNVTTIQFDYIREDSQLFSLLSRLSTTPPVQQGVAPFIALPSTWEEYLESLERTDRKELKRKFKRLETISHEFKTVDNLDQEGHFETFITLHKLSDSHKDQFMTEPMKLFFKDLFLSHIPGWQQKLAFLSIEGKPAASIFYFENEEQVLLYNSGYDPIQKYYSSGLLLCANLIKESIDNKKKIFDFLRGNERYKYDLGGKDCKLFQFLLH